MRLSEPQKGKENGRYEEPSMCRCSRHLIVEVALPTSIGSGMEKEQRKQVELGMHLGMVGKCRKDINKAINRGSSLRKPKCFLSRHGNIVISGPANKELSE